MKKILFLVLFSNTATSQVQHSITVDYDAAYFWNAEAGGPMRFVTLYNWYNIPGTINYLISKNNWGLRVGYSAYESFYGGGYGAVPAAARYDYTLYTRRYTSGNLNLLRRVIGNDRADVFATTGFTHYFKSSTRLVHVLDDGEGLFRSIPNGRNLSGFNFGVIARYRIWKGMTLQGTLSHTALFGGADFNHVSNIRFGYGYTFGGGMNRAPARQPAP